MGNNIKNIYFDILEMSDITLQKKLWLNENNDTGLISSYIGDSINFKNGIINGGLVGIILGLLVGATSGSIAFLGVIAVFGSLSVLGGIFGTILKRRI